MHAVVTRRYSFEAGHFLPKVPDGHKCKRPHGHNYEIDISVTGLTDEIGFVIDFWDLDAIVDPIITLVDHQMLNEIEGLENPTAEHIAMWFYRRIRTQLKSSIALGSVRVYETKNCWADVFSAAV